jgi:hypothetical protein
VIYFNARGKIVGAESEGPYELGPAIPIVVPVFGTTHSSNDLHITPIDMGSSGGDGQTAGLSGSPTRTTPPRTPNPGGGPAGTDWGSTVGEIRRDSPPSFPPVPFRIPKAVTLDGAG